jgi:hypothetical protein
MPEFHRKKGNVLSLKGIVNVRLQESGATTEAAERQGSVSG